MKRPDLIPSRILSRPEAVLMAARLKMNGKTIVFTNGVFDMLHQGHIFSLSQAACEGDFLIVGLNADASVKRLKGNDRPVHDQETRSLLLAALLMVDAVVIFEEDTPLELIRDILPDVLVKGGDYTVDQVAGAKEVISNGGRVVINPVLEGHSTTSLIARIRQQAGT